MGLRREEGSGTGWRGVGDVIRTLRSPISAQDVECGGGQRRLCRRCQVWYELIAGRQQICIIVPGSEFYTASAGASHSTLSNNASKHFNAA